MEIIESNKEELENKCVSLVVDQAEKTILQNGVFNLVLTGGNSIKNILTKLSKAPINWSNVNIYLTDERDVTLDDKGSNFYLVTETLLSNIKIPQENINAVQSGVLPDQIDMVILSAGEDGHVASLFPNHPSINNEETGYISVENSPKLPSVRFSMSKKTLSSAKFAILLFFGPEKYDAFQDFNNPLLSEIECPAKIVERIDNAVILCDVLK